MVESESGPVRLVYLFVSLLGVLLLAVLDYASGPEISFSVFYLAPVFLATWTVGRRAGIALSILSATVWGLIDYVSQGGYSHSLIPVWNSAVRLAFFLISVFLLASLRAAGEREHMMAHSDTLTGLPNTRTLYAALETEIARSRRSSAPFSLAYIDLDRFKLVNDSLGHAAGDALLRILAEQMSARLREIDVLARVGGDEFAILMPETDESGVERVLERVQEAARESFLPYSDDAEGLGMTIGAIVFTRPPDTLDDALTRVDALMYEGKRLGRDRTLVRVHSGTD